MKDKISAPMDDDRPCFSDTSYGNYLSIRGLVNLASYINRCLSTMFVYVRIYVIVQC